MLLAQCDSPRSQYLWASPPILLWNIEEHFSRLVCGEAMPILHAKIFKIEKFSTHVSRHFQK